MKPQGRKKVKFPGKTDCHPRDGWINWWEAYNQADSRAERHRSKQKFKNPLNFFDGYFWEDYWE